jgi:hypothetical protein
MATNTAGHATPDYLGIYLNDHLAAATAGLGVARRMASSAEPGSESAALLRTLAADMAVDRAALAAMITALAIKVRGYKMFAAWAGQHAGVLKLNGHLTTRSPLSDVEETEALRLVIGFGAAAWRTLRTLADTDSRLDAARLDDLLARADRQAAALESRRAAAAARILEDRSN